MSRENVDKARAFIAAYNRRDFDAAVESFDPEVEWVLPAHQSSDSCRGPDEVKRFWKDLRDGKMVRIEYFAEWSEALEAAGLPA